MQKFMFIIVNVLFSTIVMLANTQADSSQPSLIAYPVNVQCSNHKCLSDIAIFNPHTGEKLNLNVKDLDASSQIEWSSSGQILYKNINGALHIVDSASTVDYELISDNMSAVKAKWSPDGKKVAFLARKSEENFDLFVIDADRTNLMQLTDGLSLWGYPTWEADNENIAFEVRTNPMNPASSDIYTINLDTRNLKNLTADDRAGDFFPQWSSYENKLLFLALENNNYEIHIMDDNGQNEVFIAEGQAPRWVLGGTALVYTTPESKSNSNQQNLIFVNLENQFSKNLVSRAEMWGFDVSLDGHQLLYSVPHLNSTLSANLCIYDFDIQSEKCFTTLDMSYDGIAKWKPMTLS